MNKKGFTLVELLGVVLLLSIIAAIITIAIDSSIKTSRHKAYLAQEKNMIEAAKIYLTDHPINTNGAPCIFKEIYISDLIDWGYLDKDFKNPMTNKKYDSNTKVTIKSCGNKQNYTYELSYAEGDTDDEGSGNIEDTPFTGILYRQNGIVVNNNYCFSHDTECKFYAVAYGGVYGNGPRDIYATLDACQYAFINKYHMSESSGYKCQLFPFTNNIIYNIGEYTTNSSKLNQKVYIKHELVNDIIINSYVCFVADREYCLKGIDRDYYEENKQVLKEYKENNNISDDKCYFNSSPSYCQGINGLNHIECNSSGKATVTDLDGTYCSASASGSNCVKY